MEKLRSAFKTINFVEIVLMLSTFMGLMVRFVFQYEATIFLEVFAVCLSLVYFPFGFYFVKKPSEKYTITTSVVLGFIYALGIITILISAVNIDSYRYPMILDFSVLLALIIYLIFELRKDKFPHTYINTQFIRIGYIMVCSLFVLFK
jgi:hypothetical protein